VSAPCLLPRPATRPFFAVEAFSHATGARLWEYRLEAEGTLTPVHDKHNLATPSPVSDGSMIVAWFGTGQLVALDLTGKPLWRRHLGREISPFDIQWGHGSSPAVFGDTVFLLCDHTPASYLLANRQAHGQRPWKADRGQGPRVVQHALRRGHFVWRGSHRQFKPADRCVRCGDGRATVAHRRRQSAFRFPCRSFHDGIIYLSRGYRSGPYLAVRPGGRGDVSGFTCGVERGNRRALRVIARVFQWVAVHGQ
jgi:hypothetical protein